MQPQQPAIRQGAYVPLSSARPLRVWQAFRGDTTGASLVLRPEPRRQQPDSTLVVIAVGVVALLAAVQPASHLPAWMAVILLLTIVSGYTLGKVRIVVTGESVLVVDVPFVKGAVPRPVVRSLHAGGQHFRLHDGAGKTVLRTRMYWTINQMLELAEELGVPLFDHRTRRGWGKDARIGTRVVRDHASSRPVRLPP